MPDPAGRTLASDRFFVPIDMTFPLARAADAHTIDQFVSQLSGAASQG